MQLKRILIVSVVGLTVSVFQQLANAQPAQESGLEIEDGIVSFDPAKASILTGPAEINFVETVPKQLPMANPFVDQIASQELSRALSVPADVRLLPIVAFPKVKTGEEGTGQMSPNELGMQDVSVDNEDSAASADQGLSGLPFTSARADISGLRINEEMPFRPSGKLFFVDSGATFVCSGSMVDKGLVLTAAHCVAEFGSQETFSNFSFVPGYRNGVAPFGEWRASRVYFSTSYFDGTDVCHPQSPGIVCANDIAVIVLEPKERSGEQYFAGEDTGWYSIGWNFAGFSAQGTAQLTQLGYPGCLDHGAVMQRNASIGSVSSEFSGNVIFGSMMCEGSSGGPILVNFGNAPKLTGTVEGSFSQRNVVVGVTSWGSSNNAVKRMGASPFTDSNVEAFIRKACSDFPEACS